MKWRDADLSRDGAEMHYVGPLYVRPIGRGVVLSGLEGEPHLDDLLPEGEYFAEIRVFRWPTKKEDVPAEILTATADAFKTFAELALWLNSTGANGDTPAKIILSGRTAEVLRIINSSGEVFS
jgi:hypothetical protein